MVLETKFNDLFSTKSAQNEMCHNPVLGATRLFPEIVTVTDRFWPMPSLQLLPIQSLSRELMSGNRRDANVISEIMRFERYRENKFTNTVYNSNLSKVLGAVVFLTYAFGLVFIFVDRCAAF